MPRIVDGRGLDSRVRRALKPADTLKTRSGEAHRLPRYFFEIASWEQALALPLAPNFMLWELLTVDVREAPEQRVFPRYVPLAVTLLAAHLQALRDAVGTYVHIAANGGYRSPGHALSTHASTHCWGTAVNIYRIGDDDLDTRERIERYTRVINEVLPHAWIRPYGASVGEADDHLHLDLGYVTAVPRNAPTDGAPGETE
jgi:hypothetical protein